MRPMVTHTTAWSLFRPVAKALGCAWGAIATVGMGSPAFCRSWSTIRKSSGASFGPMTLALYIRRTALSLNQYVPKFIAIARMKKNTAPCEPPMYWPTNTRKSVRAVMRPKTFAICISVLIL